MTGTKFTLALRDARLVRSEVSALMAELTTKKARTQPERTALVQRTIRLFERLSRSFEDDAAYVGSPGAPEYAVERGAKLTDAFMATFENELRNLRLDVLSRAALMVHGDVIAAHQWVNGDPFSDRWPSPHWAALDSLEGLKASLAELAVIEGQNVTAP